MVARSKVMCVNDSCGVHGTLPATCAVVYRAQCSPSRGVAWLSRRSGRGSSAAAVRRFECVDGGEYRDGRWYREDCRAKDSLWEMEVSERMTA